MSETLTSRFITFNDPKMNEVILELPQIWWSRPYEYAWASSFVSKEHVVLDAACGICHPYKFYLCNLCQKVFACDLDARLLSSKEILTDMVAVFGPQTLNFPLEYLDKPSLSRQDLANTTYDDAMFDRIICISVLEHLSQETLFKTLLEFKRLIKDDGLIVITLDCPYLELETFDMMLNKAELFYAGEVNFGLPENALTTHLFPEFPGGLYSFRACLKKDRGMTF